MKQKTCKICPRITKNEYCCENHRKIDYVRYTGETLEECLERRKKKGLKDLLKV